MPEPPEKSAVINRFRVAHEKIPLIVQIRELLITYLPIVTIHISPRRVRILDRLESFGMCLVRSQTGSAVNAVQMAESMAFRGYEVVDYEVAIQAAIEIGWVEPSDAPNSFRPTQMGTEIREKVEQLTDEYFYGPWTVLTKDETRRSYLIILTKLHEHFIKGKESDSHL